MNYAKELSDKDIARFYRYIPIEVEDGQCIIWKGAKNQFGRPVWWYDGIHVATRVIYSLHHRVSVPHRNENGERVAVAHTCFNPACVRIEHLVLTTQKEALQMARDGGQYEWSSNCGAFRFKVSRSHTS